MMLKSLVTPLNRRKSPPPAIMTELFLGDLEPSTERRQDVSSHDLLWLMLKEAKNNQVRGVVMCLVYRDGSIHVGVSGAAQTRPLIGVAMASRLFSFLRKLAG